MRAAHGRTRAHAVAKTTHPAHKRTTAHAEATHRTIIMPGAQEEGKAPEEGTAGQGSQNQNDDDEGQHCVFLLSGNSLFFVPQSPRYKKDLHPAAGASLAFSLGPDAFASADGLETTLSRLATPLRRKQYIKFR